MTCKSIITIGRQYGSGGHEIGQKLAKELGIKNAHNMKKETLIARIEEAKAGEGQNPEGE